MTSLQEQRLTLIRAHIASPWGLDAAYHISNSEWLLELYEEAQEENERLREHVKYLEAMQSLNTLLTEKA